MRAAAALACCTIAAAAGQTQAQTLDDAGLWFATFGNGRFESLDPGSPLRWWLDAHYRLRDDTDGFNQSIVRPGLGVEVAPRHALWAGYAWIRTEPVGGGPIGGGVFDEHRFWQQWTAAPSAGDWRLLHRSRFEQRWVETGSDVGLRWRQLARAQRLLSDCPQWSLVLWDEAFFNLNDTDWGARPGLDQNRAFLGLGYKRCGRARERYEMGYLNQLINRQGGVDGMNHILSLNVFF
ncbi:MAG: DUF2490 domain-containing protein [Planctomycetota bacterium]